MTADTYLLYLLALAAFFATPPDTSQLLVISNAVKHGMRRSLHTVLGDLSANCIQMTVAAFGLTAILSVSAHAIYWVKWLGVAYLLWIGFRLFIEPPDKARIRPVRSAQLFRQGFFTSLANPYAVLFFGALFPQFIDPQADILPQMLLLGGTYLLVDGAILLAWGLLADRTMAKLKGLKLHHINRISGALMMGAAALLAAKTVEMGGDR